MRAGTKNCELQVLRPASSEASGEPFTQPAQYKTVWGYLFPQRGYEEARNDERRSLTFYQVRLDYLDGEDIVESDIIVFEGRTFNIISVMPDLATRKTVDLQLVEQRRGA